MPGADRPLDFFEALSGPEMGDVLTLSRELTAGLPFDLNSVRVRTADDPLRLFAAFAWADPLPLLGVEPEVGRSFTADEIRLGARVALLGHGSWTRDFESDPRVVGRGVEIDGEPYTIVGVLPRFASIYGVDVWLPGAEPLERLARDRRQFNLFGRLGPGRTLADLDADLASVAASVERVWAGEIDDYRGWRLRASSFERSSASSYADEAVLTLAACALVLLLIAVNLGSLHLVRGIRTRVATATRLALGAGRRRILADAIGEAAALAVAGGLLAFLFSSAGLALLNRALPGVLQPGGPPLSLDAGSLLFGTGATLLACAVLVATSVAAGARLRARDLLTVSRGVSGTAALRTAQGLLVTTQIALGLALAGGAAQVGVDVVRVLLVDPGFDAEMLVSMRLSLPTGAYEGAAVPTFFETLLEEVHAIPAVTGASIASQVAPNTVFSAEVETRDASGADERGRRLHHTVIGDGYFETMGIPLVAGRAPGPEDVEGGPPVVVLNEEAARRLFPGADAVGEQLRVRGTRFDSGWAEVVGVSRDVRNQGSASDPVPEIFTAHRQGGGRYRQMFLVARSGASPADAVPAIRDRVTRLDPAQPVYAISTPEAALGQQLAPRRVAALLLAGLAVLSVVLAAVGLHGVLAYVVATRRGELALRASLGAGPGELRALLARRAARMVGAGLATGLLLSLVLGRLLRASIGGFSATSPLLLGAACLVLAVVGAVATLLPASTAARTSPAASLRAP